MANLVPRKNLRSLVPALLIAMTLWLPSNGQAPENGPAPTDESNPTTSNQANDSSNSSSTSNSAPIQAPGPRISFPEPSFHFGVIDEGVQVKHTFVIENRGDKPLHLKSAYSTCGCTIPSIKTKEIPPGGKGELEVIMDTSMKQGDVKKPVDIRSNDPLNPTSTLYITAKVTSPHANLGTDKTAKIFTGSCARCHVKEGIGKVGEELYNADCAMCHGYRAKGIQSVAPSLIPYNYHNKDFADAFREIIAHGSKSHRSMPGFSKESGGPLNDKEIDSLIDFLRRKSDIERPAADSSTTQ